MKAQLSINGELVDEKINVDNGPRQGCTMAPTLFNLYACLMVERWAAQVEDIVGAGTCLLYKYDGKLFWRSTRGLHQTWMNEYHAVYGWHSSPGDNQVWSRASYSGLCRCGTGFWSDSEPGIDEAHGDRFGIGAADKEPITIGVHEIGCVDKFPYLGSLVSSSGRVDVQVRIASASSASRALRRAVFTDHALANITKKKVFQACVMPVLLYGC